MPDLDDVRCIALALPEAVEEPIRDWAAWRIRKRLFAWERPLFARDTESLGPAAPGLDHTPLAVRVADFETKAALLASEPDTLFTIPHFDRSPAVLIRLERIPADMLRELVVEAWLARAPTRLAAQLGV